MSKCKYVSTQKACEILDDNWTKLDNPRYDDYELTQALIWAIKALDREEKVLKALEDVKAEIAEYGSIWVGYTIKGHTDRDIQRTIEDVIKQAKAQVLEIINRKIKEHGGEA